MNSQNNHMDRDLIGIQVENLCHKLYSPMKHALRMKLFCNLGNRIGLSWAKATSIEQLCKERVYFANYAFAETDNMSYDPALRLTPEDVARFSVWASDEYKLQCKAEYETAPPAVKNLFDSPIALGRFAEQICTFSSYISRKHGAAIETVLNRMQASFPDMDQKEFLEISSYMEYLMRPEEDSTLHIFRPRYRIGETNVLTMLAILNNISCFSEDDIPVAEALAQWLMQRPEFTKAATRRLIELIEDPLDDLIKVLLLSDSSNSADAVLLEAVTEGRIIEEGLKEQSLQRLFLRYIDMESLRYFMTHEKDDNYSFISVYIRSHFEASVCENNPQFYYAAAALQIRTWEEQKKNCIAEAMQNALSENENEAFIAIIALGLLSWSKYYDKFSSKSNVCVDPAFTERIISNLFTPDTSLHRAAYASISDLIAGGYISRLALVRSKTIQQAFSMLHNPEYVSRAEDILSECSIRSVGQPLPEDAELKARYCKKYSEATSVSQKAYLLPICAVLNCWSREDLRNQVLQLQEDVSAASGNIDSDVRYRIGELACEVSSEKY